MKDILLDFGPAIVNNSNAYIVLSHILRSIDGVEWVLITVDRFRKYTCLRRSDIKKAIEYLVGRGVIKVKKSGSSVACYYRITDSFQRVLCGESKDLTMIVGGYAKDSIDLLSSNGYHINLNSSLKTNNAKVDILKLPIIGDEIWCSDGAIMEGIDSYDALQVGSIILNRIRSNLEHFGIDRDIQPSHTVIHRFVKDFDRFDSEKVFRTRFMLGCLHALGEYRAPHQFWGRNFMSISKPFRKGKHFEISYWERWYIDYGVDQDRMKSEKIRSEIDSCIHRFYDKLIYEYKQITGLPCNPQAWVLNWLTKFLIDQLNRYNNKNPNNPKNISDVIIFYYENYQNVFKSMFWVSGRNNIQEIRKMRYASTAFSEAFGYGKMNYWLELYKERKNISSKYVGD